MECVELKNGRCYRPTRQVVPPRGLKRKLGTGDAGGVRLDVAAAVRGARAVPPPVARAGTAPPDPVSPCAFDAPFMSGMDEISYWVHTKRAPCLLNYDNLFKKQNVETDRIELACTAEEVPSPKKKKRRKLSILDDGSVSQEKQQNIYFEASQLNQRTILSSCKSGTVSDIDFNIKNSSIHNKTKRLKQPKNSRTTLHKKNKVVTSTPKATAALRRSLRKAQNSLNNNQRANSFQVYNSCVINGSNMKKDSKHNQTTDKLKKSPEILENGHRNITDKKIATKDPNHQSVHNGQFEDLSDVSGFTANYIRSTKMQSTKTPRIVRSKSSRNLMKESQDLKKNEEATMFVCVNKCVNTTDDPVRPALNCSTDSSQNFINLMTVKNFSRCNNNKINKSTSLLKFIDATAIKKKESDTNNATTESIKQANKTNLNISFQTDSSGATRYPKRHKKDVATVITETNQHSFSKRRKVNKNSKDFNNSDRKENPEEQSISRTRSGRSIARVHEPEKSVLVFSYSTEPVSSTLTLNVAGPTEAELPRDTGKRKGHKSSTNYTRLAKKSIDKSGQSINRDSLRDKSGFTVCFSDSDDDSDTLKQQKFFC